jgi:hypothetical protein
VGVLVAQRLAERCDLAEVQTGARIGRARKERREGKPCRLRLDDHPHRGRRRYLPPGCLLFGILTINDVSREMLGSGEGQFLSFVAKRGEDR